MIPLQSLSHFWMDICQGCVNDHSKFFNQVWVAISCNHVKIVCIPIRIPYVICVFFILMYICHNYTIYTLYLVTTDHHPCLRSFKCCDSNRAGRWPLRPAGTETATQSQVLVGVVVKGSAKKKKLALRCWEWWSIAPLLLGGALFDCPGLTSWQCWKNTLEILMCMKQVHIDETISTILCYPCHMLGIKVESNHSTYNLFALFSSFRV